MTSFYALPMAAKTLTATVFFMTLATAVAACIFVGGKQGRIRRALLFVTAAVMAAMLLLYASVIPAERAKAYIPAVSAWFASQPYVLALFVWLLAALFTTMVIAEEYHRRRHAVTASSIKESLDRLETGLCFSYASGLVILSNYRMNELSHTICGAALQNANLFWDALAEGEPAAGVERIASGEHPEFLLPDGSVWTFGREGLQDVIQITAANTTQQHQLLREMKEKRRDLEEMNARIRSYGEQVDEYIVSRERLETRVNLHGFLGQALLMTRHYLQYESGSPQKIIDIWQRNIDVLRMEAEPQHEADSLLSLQ